MKLDIGCGGTKLGEGWEGVDIADFGQKYIIDIEKDGLKDIPSDAYELVVAHNVLEHIEGRSELMVFNEVHRVLKKGGVFHIIVPTYGSTAAAADPTHVNDRWVARKFTEYYAGKRPRNAKYDDINGVEMKKWAISNDGNGNYILDEGPKSIDIKLYKP